MDKCFLICLSIAVNVFKGNRWNSLDKSILKLCSFGNYNWAILKIYTQFKPGKGLHPDAFWGLLRV